ncbi:hypothetical protein K440DRAFT_245533 [Wilcoxina mikolae CBS 423.85]|nr:hypothetical protein K440DRAFT_245533 [Wilcoxina mikolae CBS 423.85]
MARSVTPRRVPRQNMMPPQPDASSNNNNEPWYHDADYPGDPVNLLRDPDDVDPRTNEFTQYRNWILEIAINGSEEIGRWRRYIAAVEDAWVEYFEEAEDRAMENRQLRAESQQLREGANCGREEDVDRATREALAARAQAEEAQQEIAQLRTQLAEAHEATRTVEQAVRTMMSVSPRNLNHNDEATGTRNMTFTINLKRLPVFKGERDMQIVGDFINDLQRQFEAHCYEIGWLTTYGTSTPAGSGIATPTTSTMMGEGTPRTDGWTRSLKEEFTPLDALRNFEDEWRLLMITAKGQVATFYE